MGGRPESAGNGRTRSRGSSRQLSVRRRRGTPERNQLRVLQRVFLENKPSVLNIYLQKRGKNNHEQKPC